MLQKEALEILKMGHNVFLTGRAGSGKTHVLNRYISFLKEKEASVGVTASTGVAATHLNGMTIHSWTGMGILDDLTKKDLEHILKKRYLSKRMKNTEVLVIDEVSMLSANQLDIADRIIRAWRNSNQPFGGMQVVLCGDFFQLPPVSGKNEEGSGFAYQSRAWDELGLKVCYLSEQYRHEEGELLSVLNAIRTNNINEHVMDLLRSRYKADVQGGDEVTKLYTHNFNVDNINSKQLKKLPGDSASFHMHTEGSGKLAETLSRNLLAPVELNLKKDALVMFVKNNFDRGYANGTLGRVVDLSHDVPIVETKHGDLIEVGPEKWSIEEDGKIKAEVQQLPLRLAWAITVHKSQGMTLDAAEIDLSRSFEPGMGYVALSRVRSLEGIRLMGVNDVALQVDEEIIEMDEQFQKLSEEQAEELNRLSDAEKKKLKDRWEEKTKETGKKIDTKEKTRRLVDSGMSIKEAAEERDLKESTIIGHIEKLLYSGKELDISHLNIIPDSRFNKMRKALLSKNNPEMKLSPAKKKLGNDYSYDELRFARLFLHKEK